MHPLDEAKQLVGKVGQAKERRLERLVEDLRDEFDTLHRACRLLLDDLDRIETRLSDVVSHSECDMVKKDLLEGSESITELRNVLNIQELRIKHLESVLDLTKRECQANAGKTVINVTGAAVGKDVAGDVNVND